MAVTAGMPDGRPRRVAVVSASLAMGGAERVAAFLARSLAEAGWATTLITLADEADFYALPPEVARVRLALAGTSRSRLQGAIATLRRAAALRRALRSVAPDVVIALQMQVNCVALLAAAGTGVPVIASDRVAPSRDPLERGPWRWAVRGLYPRAARLVCVSRGIAAERGWLAPARRVVIPNAVQLDAGPAPGDPVLAPADAPHLVALGRLAPVKGFDLLLAAFAKLADAHPAWHLTIIGEGPERDRLEGLAARLGIAGRVHLPGAARAPAALLRAAAASGGVFAFPSRFEGFGFTLIEAMACGLPVVAADCRHGPAEILEGGSHGLLVPAEDVAALAAALAQVMGDAALRAELAARARARAEAYAPERIAPLWCALAEQVAAEARPRLRSGAPPAP
jgi:glycosyltransferase involved in cell wall biosynthesis